MRFRPTSLEGVLVVEQEPASDERGLFARTFCSETFRDLGLMAEIAQSSLSVNTQAGTLRGLHYQRAPHEEAKLVRCTRGALFDVAVDLREGSPTHGAWTAVELTQSNGLMIYIPEGCAHGFQTLVDDTQVEYDISIPYDASHSDGIRWDDPQLAIAWPDPPHGGERIISPRDQSLPLLAG
jgi:dTDP-4-dehydrorhamnose 3,5-epimerase